jgi:TonB-dependent starch-binding outer membrane protein SusC
MKLNPYRSIILRLCLVISLSGMIRFAVPSQIPQLLVRNNEQNTTPNNNQITNILKELEVKYNVFFTYRDKTLKGKIVPQNLRKSGKLEVILDFLLKSQNIEYKKAGNVFYLYSPEELTETKIKNTLLIDGKSMNDGVLDKANFNTKLFVNNEINPLSETIIPIKGNIVSENGEPMPGVSIRLKGTQNGTSSDLNGHYDLRASEKSDNSVLLFSMIGYKTTEISLRGRSSINVTLSPDVKSLGEVVVVGYGTQQRKDLTGSVTSISMEDIKNIPITGIDQAMQGKASGVIVNNNSGQPGASVSVRIRGITSVTSSNEPLYVIDGIPFSGDGSISRSQSFDEFGGGGGQTNQSVLASLNPNDIATIDILKDASATAIYGARASNGVVIITTKRGKANESKISYDSYFGFQEVTKKLSVLNLREYAEYQNQIRKENSLSPIAEFINPQILGNGTDWQNGIFRKGAIQSHQLSFSGGKDKTQFYISGGYFKQDGIVVGSNFDRYSVRVNLDNQIKKWLKVGNSFSVSRTNQRTILTDTDDGVISGALLQAPSVPIHFADGSWGGAEDPLASFAINPVALALQKDVTRIQTRFNGNLWADLTLFDGLSFRGEIGGDMSFTKNSAFNPTYKWGVTENTQSKYIRREEQLSYWNAKAFLNYNKVFANLHRLSAMLGHEAQYSYYEALNSVAIGLTSNEVQSLNLGDPKLSSNYDEKVPWAMESFLSRVNYNYDDRFNLTLTYRLDGSSNFGPNKRWGQFPSVAAAWTISKEAFMKDIVAFSNLKIRAGYGAVGNQQLPSYSYGALLKSVGTSFGNGYYVDKIPNPNLQWEAAQQTNIGLDLGLLKNRFNLSLDIYKKVSNNFLLQASLPAFTGAGQNWDDVKAPFINAGEMQNTGIDITLNTNNVNSQYFKWNTNLVFSHYKNQINALVSQNDAFYEHLQWYDNITRTAVGSSVGMFYGYNTKGLFQNVEQIKNSPAQSKDGKINERSGTYPGDIIFADNNGDGQVDGQDRVYIGSPHPDFTFGITNTFNYKNFDLSVFVQGSQGAKVFNFIRFRTEGMNDLFPNQLSTIKDRWTPENTSGILPRFILGDPNDNRRVSDRFIEDGSYVRIQNISFGYTFPTGLLDRAFIKKLKVYASLQNLYTFTKYSSYDPEIGSFNQNSKLSNVDNGHYPIPRTFTLGVNVEF